MDEQTVETLASLNGEITDGLVCTAVSSQAMSQSTNAKIGSSKVRARSVRVINAGVKTNGLVKRCANGPKKPRKDVDQNFQRRTTAQILKRRFGFTITKDVHLLKSAVSINPWQLGEQKWNDVSTDLNERFQYETTERTAKERVLLIIKKYQQNETGTEEERTERGEILETIISLQEEANSTINIDIGADHDEEFDIVFDEGEVNKIIQESTVASRSERRSADEDRDKALAGMSMNKSDDTAQPNKCRSKRRVLSVEDEMTQVKQPHEMAMEKERLESERSKSMQMFELEKEKVEIEKEKIELEKAKLAAVTAQNVRRDEIHNS